MLKRQLVIFFLLLSLKADENIPTFINQDIPTIKKKLKEVSIQKKYKKNKTLLHYAVEARNFNTVSFLVSQKIFLSSQGGAYNNTALQDAISYGYLKIAYYLIKKGTPLNIKNRYGQTALHIASAKSYRNIIKALLANGADKSAIDNSGYRPYDLIAKLSFSSNREIEKLLQTRESIKEDKSYREYIFIDKKSEITNSHIGIQIKE